jgi:hypothetical protein
LYYNPRTVIRAVNELLPLGKEKSLALIEEFVRVISPPEEAPGRTGESAIFPVLRVLFEVPSDPGYMPEMLASPDSPKDKKLLPRYPVCLEEDIPFFLSDWRNGDGGDRPPDAQEDIDYFRRHGRLRARPLRPTDKPWDAITAFAKSPRWKALPRRNQRDQLYGLQYEMLNLLDSVYQIDPDPSREMFPFWPAGAAQRQKVLNEVARLKIRWNPSENQYTFLDGRSLPPRPAKIYRREIWVPKVPGCRVKFALGRESSRDLTVEIMERGKLDTPRPKMVFKVYRVGAGDKPIGEFRPQGEDMGESGTLEETYWTTTMNLPEGAQVKVELLLTNKIQTSPVLKP